MELNKSQVNLTRNLGAFSENSAGFAERLLGAFSDNTQVFFQKDFEGFEWEIPGE